MNAAAGILLLAQICVSQSAKLEGHDSLPGDHFGCSVDMVADRIVVGAENNRPISVGTLTGAVYVFELSGSTWVQQAQLTPSNAKPKGLFGHAIGCDASRIVVGAPAAYPTSMPGVNGLVYVYAGGATSWLEEALINPADASAYRFGEAVDIDGDTLLIGAPEAPGGAAFVYVRSGANWVQQAKLTASDFNSTANFGDAVLIRDTLALVGASNADGGQPASGAVYVFTRSGTTWSQTQKLTASNGQTGDSFGQAIDLDGTTIAIGAYLTDTGPWSDHGGVYTFEWNGQQWLEHIAIQVKGYSQTDHSGRAVAVDAGQLVFGAPSELFAPSSLHLYAKSNTTWIQHLKFKCSDGPPYGGSGNSSWLGEAVALQGTRLVAGAGNVDGTSLPQTGAAYVFNVQTQNSAPTFYCTAKTDSKGCRPRFHHEGIASATGTLQGHPYRVKSWDILPKVPGMLFYGTNGAASVPFAGGFNCIQQPLRPTQMELTKMNGMPLPCNGQFIFDFNAWIASGNDPSLTAGQDVWMQYWYRDPTGMPGSNIGLTDGIYVSICP